MGEQEDKAKFWTDLEARHRAEMLALIDFLGPKTAAVMLRPDRFIESPDAGQRWLADCYNPNKRDRLNGFDEMKLMRAAQIKGYHKAKHFHDVATGYHPAQPKSIADEKADTLEQVRALQEQMNAVVSKLAGLNAIEKEVKS